jgi:hypothetical protein
MGDKANKTPLHFKDNLALARFMTHKEVVEEEEGRAKDNDRDKAERDGQRAMGLERSEHAIRGVNRECVDGGSRRTSRNVIQNDDFGMGVKGGVVKIAYLNQRRHTLANNIGIGLCISGNHTVKSIDIAGKQVDQDISPVHRILTNATTVVGSFTG